MDLLNVLKTNGTGLLRGLCRPHSRETFQEVEGKWEGHLSTVLDFSFGIEFLGTYSVIVESLGIMAFNEKGWEARIDVEGSGCSVCLMIDFSLDDDFGEFHAVCFPRER